MSERFDAVMACALKRWSPAIGDPTPMGWLTVALYVASAALAALVVARSGGFPAETRARERLFWIGLCALLLALAINKQLDLQSLLTAAGRCAAKLDGWFDQRRPAQARFIGALLAGAMIGALALAVLLRGALRRQGPALLGVLVLTAFVLVRAVGFHHVDALISVRVNGWRVNWILEMGAIALVALGALWALAAIRAGRSAP